jgi:hypothetical protein
MGHSDRTSMWQRNLTAATRDRRNGTLAVVTKKIGTTRRRRGRMDGGARNPRLVFSIGSFGQGGRAMGCAHVTPGMP